jgi:hypothetical protein
MASKRFNLWSGPNEVPMIFLKKISLGKKFHQISS